MNKNTAGFCLSKNLWPDEGTLIAGLHWYPTETESGFSV